MEMLLNSGKQRVCGPVENLYRRHVALERPVRNQRLNSGLVVADEMRLLHVEIVKEVADAVATIQRTSNHVIQAEAGFPVFNDVPQRVRQIRRRAAERDNTLSVLQRCTPFMPSTTASTCSRFTNTMLRPYPVTSQDSGGSFGSDSIPPVPATSLRSRRYRTSVCG